VQFFGTGTSTIVLELDEFGDCAILPSWSGFKTVDSVARRLDLLMKKDCDEVGSNT
jgi:hypothetical protein